MERKGAVSTGMLFREIQSAERIERFFDEYEPVFRTTPFHVYLNQLCVTRDRVPERVILNAGIQRTYGHQLFNGRRAPSRDKAIQLCFGFSLNLEEAQALLRAARLAALYPKIKRDAAIIYALSKPLDFMETQDLLGALSLTLLGGSDRDV